jgi:pyruvate,orthophosphate dikinase
VSSSFSSKALEANLTQTKVDVVVIPEDQLWFGELSKGNWDIYKRTHEFLTELNHTLRNDTFVIEALHAICLNDIWFYESHEATEKALDVIMDIFTGLFETVEGETEKDLLIKCLFICVDRLAALKKFPTHIIWRAITLIQGDFAKDKQGYIQNSRYFITYFDQVARQQPFTDVTMRLSRELLTSCYDYWQETTQIEAWYTSKKQLLHVMTIESLQVIGPSFFDALRESLNNAKDWDALHDLMTFNDISNYFRSFTKKFESHHETIHYLYYLLRLPGMAHYKKHLLYDMNRNLRSVFVELEEGDIREFIDLILSEFMQLKETQSSTVLDCVLTLGKEIIHMGNKQHISYFITRLIHFGFEHPGLPTLNADWQTRINATHVKSIRTWLELIGAVPGEMRELLAALIVNLKLGGIFISDTDLFQRDVTKLLNADIAPVYREIKQLAKIFPIYFRDIGAEGKLRDYSTAVDELSMRKDRLIHFMRKQIHTESNNTHIKLTKRIIRYWHSKDSRYLDGILPDDVKAWLGTEPEYIIGVHHMMTLLRERTGKDDSGLFSLGIEAIENAILAISYESNNNTLSKRAFDRDKHRVLNLYRVYFLVLEKYALESEDIIRTLTENSIFERENLVELENYLNTGSHKEALKSIYRLMAQLKARILDKTESKGYENIFFKRHVAAGIPSMYGQYIEPKFEALGLIYRLEKTASKLMERAIKTINRNYITAKTLGQIYEILELFKEGMALDGIVNEAFNSRLNMYKFSLTSPSFSYDQYVNIFQFMARDIKSIIDEYFIEVYERPLKIIAPQIDAFYSSQESTEAAQKSHIGQALAYQMVSERFYRDNLYTAFLVQDLDQLIIEVLGTLDAMRKTYSADMIQNMMTYNPNTVITALDVTTPEIDNPVFLGTKAFFMKRLFELGFPIPRGFVLTTEVFRHKETITKHKFIKKELDAMILKQLKRLEKSTGKRFGDPEKPLFVSVRSGSTFSMPGAMRTFLNVGMNEEIAESYSLQKDNAWTSWDSFRRFLQSWGMANGVERDVFEQIMKANKQKYGVKLKAEFTGIQMKAIAQAYKVSLEERGVTIETNPLKQLNQAIYSVIDSWFSSSAKTYRDHMEIAEEWGTAILVQQMVLGNKSRQSGTGVVFTNSPFNDLSGLHLFGDYVRCSQGEDVVSGLVNTLAISENQRKLSKQECFGSLESDFPQIYRELSTLAAKLIEQHGFVHQEIEFTFESEAPEDLYILQIRNQKLKKKKVDESTLTLFDRGALVGRGIGVNSGLITGYVAFDAEDSHMLKAKFLDRAHANEDAHASDRIILIRPYTVPDDIPLIFAADALVTAKGGITSHAAVTAAGLGKVCIVNCRSLTFDDNKKTCSFDGQVFKVGDKMTLDGYLGNIYRS